MTYTEPDTIRSTVVVEAPREIIEAMRDNHATDADVAAALVEHTEMEFELRASEWSARID